MTMNITLNGKPQNLDKPLSISALVESLGYKDKRIAVERNGHIVPKGQHAQVNLDDGDEIEIVVAVGGG